ncbi:MAG: ATP-binding cassette domain-containing protein, partial [Halobacteriaceae archaeon]
DYSSQLTQVRVIDEVTIPLLSRGLSGDKAKRRAKELLAKVQLEGYENKKTWELSGGEQQRVAIAAILAIDPDVLIFDNAIDMLDPKGQMMVTNLISSLAEDTTLVVTATDPQQLIGVADDLVVLDSGEVVRKGSADSVLREHDLFTE